MTIREYIDQQMLKPLTSKRMIKTIHDVKNMAQILILRDTYKQIMKGA